MPTRQPAGRGRYFGGTRIYECSKRLECREGTKSGARNYKDEAKRADYLSNRVSEMNEAYQLLLGHGYTIIFLFALAERIGFPLLLMPLMITAGALAGTGRMSLIWAVTLTSVAFLLGDLLWYELGRRRGPQALRLLCRLSLSPDSCVRGSKRVMEKHAEYSLLYSKFVPGVGRVVPPLAGTLGMQPWRFVVFSVAGSILWALSIGLMGYIPARQMSGTQLAQAV